MNGFHRTLLYLFSSRTMRLFLMQVMTIDTHNSMTVSSNFVQWIRKSMDYRKVTNRQTLARPLPFTEPECEFMKNLKRNGFHAKLDLAKDRLLV